VTGMYDQCLCMLNWLLISKQYLLAVCGNIAVIYELSLIRDARSKG